MLSPDELTAYLGRIGYSGSLSPNRALLGALQLAHLTTIPFETLDSLTGRTPRLEQAALVEKLVHGRRGGYCYEHNRLFMAALEAIGFEPVALLGRVLMGVLEEAETPRTHMLLRVRVEGQEFIVDTGFGGQVLTGPMELASGRVQATPHEPYRLDETDGLWSLRAQVGGDWRLLCRFTLEPTLPIDHEVANHYVATHPASLFSRALVAALILPRGRLTLLNHRLTEHRLGELSRIEIIGNDEALRAILAERFGVVVDDAQWAQAMRKVPRAAS